MKTNKTTCIHTTHTSLVLEMTDNDSSVRPRQLPGHSEPTN